MQLVFTGGRFDRFRSSNRERRVRRRRFLRFRKSEGDRLNRRDSDGRFWRSDRRPRRRGFRLRSNRLVWLRLNAEVRLINYFKTEVRGRTHGIKSPRGPIRRRIARLLLWKKHDERLKSPNGWLTNIPKDDTRNLWV